MLSNQGSQNRTSARAGTVRSPESTFTAVPTTLPVCFRSRARPASLIPEPGRRIPLGVRIIRQVRPETFRRVCMSFDAWVVGLASRHYCDSFTSSKPTPRSPSWPQWAWRHLALVPLLRNQTLDAGPPGVRQPRDSVEVREGQGDGDLVLFPPNVGRLDRSYRSSGRPRPRPRLDVQGGGGAANFCPCSARSRTHRSSGRRSGR